MCRKCEKLTRVNLPDIVKIPDITLELILTSQSHVCYVQCDRITPQLFLLDSLDLK